MSPIELEEIGTTGCDVVSNRADLRRDIHVFVGYVGEHEVKRGHRDNQLPSAHRQRLARLMSDPAQAGQTDEDGISPWIRHVDEVCLELQLVGYDTEGSCAGWSSSSASFPDNFIQRKGAQYERFLDLPLAAQEERIRAIHLDGPGKRPSEFFVEGPLSRLDRFDSWASATGVVPTIRFAEVRSKLLGLLAECPTGVWFSTRSLLEHLRRHDPWFLIPERVPAAAAAAGFKKPGRYVNFIERKRGDWANRTSIADRDPEGFAKVEGRFLERFLEGIPLVLGYVEVAYLKRRPDDAALEPTRGLLAAFRVTERLRPALRGAIAAPKVTVLPNFEVHVESLFFPAKLESRLLLLGEATQRGIVSVYRLTKSKVAASLALNPEFDVIKSLEELSGRELPANVAAELNEWAGHSEKFILYGGFGLLEGRRDEAGADRFVVESISPTFAVVRSPAGLYRHLETTEQVPAAIRHPDHALAAPAGVRTRLAPSVARSTAGARKPVRIQRTVETTLRFLDAQAHGAFLKILLDARCVLPADAGALTLRYGKRAEPLVKDCLKKLAEQYPVAFEDVEK